MAQSGGNDFENVDEEERPYNNEKYDMDEDYGGGESFYEGDGENYEQVADDGDENYRPATKRGKGDFK